MTLKNRLAKLEQKTQPAESDVARMKPSEILRRADELIAQGAQPTKDQRARLEALRKAAQ